MVEFSGQGLRNVFRRVGTAMGIAGVAAGGTGAPVNVEAQPIRPPAPLVEAAPAQMATVTQDPNTPKDPTPLPEATEVPGRPTDPANDPEPTAKRINKPSLGNEVYLPSALKGVSASQALVTPESLPLSTSDQKDLSSANKPAQEATVTRAVVPTDRPEAPTETPQPNKTSLGNEVFLPNVNKGYVRPNRQYGSTPTRTLNITPEPYVTGNPPTPDGPPGPIPPTPHPADPTPFPLRIDNWQPSNKPIERPASVTPLSAATSTPKI